MKGIQNKQTPPDEIPLKKEPEIKPPKEPEPDVRPKPEKKPEIKPGKEQPSIPKIPPQEVPVPPSLTERRVYIGHSK